MLLQLNDQQLSIWLWYIHEYCLIFAFYPCPSMAPSECQMCKPVDWELPQAAFLTIQPNPLYKCCISNSSYILIFCLFFLISLLLPLLSLLFLIWILWHIPYNFTWFFVMVINAYLYSLNNFSISFQTRPQFIPFFIHVNKCRAANLICSFIFYLCSTHTVECWLNFNDSVFWKPQEFSNTAYVFHTVNNRVTHTRGNDKQGSKPLYNLK
jgi:hypothetical protein